MERLTRLINLGQCVLRAVMGRRGAIRMRKGPTGRASQRGWPAKRFLDVRQKVLAALILLARYHLQLIRRRLRADHEAAEASNSEVERVRQHADRIATHGCV